MTIDSEWESILECMLQVIEGNPNNAEAYKDCLGGIKTYKTICKDRAYYYNSRLRKSIQEHMDVMDAECLKEATSVLEVSYKIEAYDIFDSYLIYLEWRREPDKRFYLPRRRVLKRIVDDLQDLEDRKIKFLSVSMPPRTGKTTLCIMFMTWVMGRHPLDASVMSGHSDKLTDGFYHEVLSIITDDEQYNYARVFPESFMVYKSEKNEQIDLRKRQRFPTLTCRSVGGTLTGAVEIGNDGLLYTDDLIEDLEESLNPERLQNKYDAYLNQLKDRKKDKAKELMIGTRWNVYDPQGRIQEQYEGNPLYRFTVIPAMNEKDESNFVYDYDLGFSTEYYRDMRESIDDNTWCAKYMGDPYVREGLLFPADELKYYNGSLPPGEPDRVLAVCDVAWGGGDYLSMPIAYCYGRSVYVHDVVFSNGAKDVTQPMVVAKIKQHNPHSVRFEGNNGGMEYAYTVDKTLRADGCHINVTQSNAPTDTAKKSRILRMSPEIKDFYFIDKMNSTKEYKAFMKQVTTYSISGKQKHDDATDSLSMLAGFIGDTGMVCKIFERPF